jgi:hypothetical protein
MHPVSLLLQAHIHGSILFLFCDTVIIFSNFRTGNPVSNWALSFSGNTNSLWMQSVIEVFIAGAFFSIGFVISEGAAAACSFRHFRRYDR